MDLGEFGDREKEGKRGEATSEGKKESMEEQSMRAREHEGLSLSSFVQRF